MRHIGLSLVAVVAIGAGIFVGCGGGGGSSVKLDGGTHPDMTQVQNCQPNCSLCGGDDGCGHTCQTGTCPSGKTCQSGVCTGGTMTGTLACYDVFLCYINNSCQDQTCLGNCDAMAKNPQFATDAEALLMCLDTAIGPDAMHPGPCGTPCNAAPSDMSIAQCQQCLYGMCQRMSNMTLSCSGGQCSTQGAGCYNEK